MKIVILSQNPNLYSTKRLIEAGIAKGHEMQIIDHSKCDLIIEKKKPGLIYQGKEIEDVDGVIPRIGASITFYGTAVVRQFENDESIYCGRISSIGKVKGQIKKSSEII